MKKFSLVFAGLFLVACSISTANLSDVKMCTEIKDNQCATDGTSFGADTPEIFVSTILNNAPEGTNVKFTWRYLDKDIDIDSINITSEHITSTMQSSLSIPSDGWPVGNYEVIIKIDSDNSEAIHKAFKVE